VTGRRLATALALAAGLAAAPFATAPALACNPPAEGEPGPCCTPPELIGIDVAGQHIGVPDPTWKPWACD
jgi:hypothetical protein